MSGLKSFSWEEIEGFSSDETCGWWHAIPIMWLHVGKFFYWNLSAPILSGLKILHVLLFRIRNMYFCCVGSVVLGLQYSRYVCLKRWATNKEFEHEEHPWCLFVTFCWHLKDVIYTYKIFHGSSLRMYRYIEAVDAIGFCLLPPLPLPYQWLSFRY